MPIHDIPKSRSPGVIVAGLARGTKYRTDVDRGGAAGCVYLKPGDEQCSTCDTLIDGETFPGADYANLLARQRLKYGATYCPECLGDADAE